MRRLLIIAGSDSSCGAGIARDLAVAAGLGAAPRLCITAVTAQDAGGVRAIYPVPADVIAAQIAAAGPVAAVKIGMLADAPTLRAVATALNRSNVTCPVVLDPVLSASAGGALLNADGVAALHGLLPRLSLITPNLPEAAALTGHNDITDQGCALLRQGAAAVLIKGGHGGGALATDWLFEPDQPPRAFSHPRRPVTRRGTGCTLSTAIACALAAGATLPDAITAARACLDDWLGNDWPGNDLLGNLVPAEGLEPPTL